MCMHEHMIDNFKKVTSMGILEQILHERLSKIHDSIVQYIYNIEKE